MNIKFAVIKINVRGSCLIRENHENLYPRNNCAHIDLASNSDFSSSLDSRLRRWVGLVTASGHVGVWHDLYCVCL